MASPRVIGFSRSLLALASVSVAMLCLTYGDSALIGQSVPTWMPGREIWIYGSAFLLLLASVGLGFSRVALLSAMMIAAYLAIWGLTCTPQIASHPISIGGWYSFCEALTSLIGAWIVYAMLRAQSGRPQIPLTSAHAMRVARILFGFTCVFYGWSHFAYPDYTASMVPSALPGRVLLAYFTGLAHIAAGVGLISGILPRLAATLEATMMSLFGLLVWVPSFFAQPRPAWATVPQNQWSELVVNILLASSAWIVAVSLTDRVWVARSR